MNVQRRIGMNRTARIAWIVMTLLLVLGLSACSGGSDDSTDGDETPPADTDLDQVDGDGSDGDAIDGDTIDGDGTDGDTIDGDTTDGDGSDGDTIDGDTTDADLDDTDGDNTDTDPVDGDGVDGDAPDGDLDLVDVDPVDGDGVDGDVPDGDDTEADIADGDVAEADPDIEPDEEIEPDIVQTCTSDVLETIPYEDDGTLIGATNDLNPACETGLDLSGADVVYEFFLDSDQVLEVTLTPYDNADLVLYVVQECRLYPTCLELADNSGAGEAETLSYRPVSSGTFFVVVDSKLPDVQSSYHIKAAYVPYGDTLPSELCEEDLDCSIVFGDGRCIGGSDVNGFNLPYSVCSVECDTDAQCDDFNGGCCVDIPRLGKSFCAVSAFCGVQGQESEAGEACGTATVPNEPQCIPTSQMANPCLDNASSPYCSLECTTDNDCSDFTDGCCVDAGLAFKLCLHGDDCAGSCQADLAIDPAFLPQTDVNDLTDMGNRVNAFGCDLEGGGTLGGSPGQDFLYDLILAEGERVRLTLTPDTDWNAILMIVEECGWTNSDTACLAAVNDGGVGATEVLEFTAPEWGHYIIVVDSTVFGQAGGYDLNLQFVEVVDGDMDEEIEAETDADETVVDGDVACEADVVIARGDLPYSHNGSTAGMAKRFTYQDCVNLSEPMWGSDAVYELDLYAGDHLYVELSDVAGWNPSLILYTACEDNTCVTGSDNGLPGVSEGFEYIVPSNGVYYLVVDTVNINETGSYHLEVSLNPFVDGDEEIPVDGDEEIDEEVDTPACSADFVIDSLPYVNTGDTTASDDTITELTGYGQCPYWLYNKPDHLYALTMSYGDGVLIRLEDGIDSDFDPALMVVDDCENLPRCMHGVDQNGVNAGEFLDFVAPEDGTYYILIDSGLSADSSASSGQYELHVEAGYLDGDID